MTPPEPPIDEPDREGHDACAWCDCWPCECDRAYDAYRDLQMED